MVKAIVAGASGRMGRKIISAISQTDGIELSGAFEKKGHPDIGRDAGDVAGIGNIGVKIEGSFEDVIERGDVLIDFTVPEATLYNAKLAAKKGLPMVIGTTGFTAEMMNELRETVKDIPCVISPNMSIGVNVLFKIVADVCRILGEEYDVEIIEAHHHFKKDAPSGTALRIAEIIASQRKASFIYGRKGILGERKKEEIGIHAIRAGDIVGEHIVIFGGEGERIELVHRAHSRDCFAKGAVRAALWIVGKKPGIYSMQDVLGI